MTTNFRVAIIGSGWYGCHLALSLAKRGLIVDLYDKDDKIFNGASRFNQNRLHEGYHYPRDYETRRQSKVGFDYFLKTYPALVEKIEENIYAVARKNSLIDFETYKTIMLSNNLSFEEKNFDFLNRDLVAGSIITNEMLIRNDLAGDYFAQALASAGVNVYLNRSISKDQFLAKEINGVSYNFVVNTSWGALETGLLTKYEVYFEPCIYFYYSPYEPRYDNFALTLMDGALFSLYPFSNGLYTLTSVEHTPISKTNSYDTAIHAIQDVCEAFIKKRRELFEGQCVEYFPEFLEKFSYEGFQLSIKTKINSASDSRYCIVESENGCIDVFSGKIDTINYAEEKVNQLIFGE